MEQSSALKRQSKNDRKKRNGLLSPIPTRKALVIP